MRHPRPPVSWIAIDFEWHAAPGALPVPLCLTAIESATGREHRLLGRDLERLSRPPFPIDDSVVVCAYSIASDLVPWRVLGWKFPENVLCCYAEHRVRYNGIPSPFDDDGDDLLGACVRRGVVYTSTKAVKAKQRARFADLRPLDPDEAAEALTYCMADSRATLALAQSYERDGINWDRGLFWGRYCKALAAIEFNGVPVDTEILELFQQHRDAARLAMIEDGDRDIGCYENGVLKNHLVWDLAKREGIAWGATRTGRPRLDDDELKLLGFRYPVTERFRQLKKSVGALRSNKYAAGSDGRSHVSAHPFATKTGRNAPKGSENLFLGPAWIRGFMKAPPGKALIYLDLEAEEFAIDASLSGDLAKRAAYESGDPYIATGVLMKQAPPGATKDTHPAVRALCKVIALALCYGMTSWGLARRLGVEEEVAAEYMEMYAQAFPRSHVYAEGMLAHVKAVRHIETLFGWQMYVERRINPRTLLNWPMQSTGADLLRLIAVALVERGYKVLALIHDAVLLEAAIEDIEMIVDRASALMADISEQAIGIRLRVDRGNKDKPHIFPYPARFRDGREGDSYDRAIRLLREAASKPQVPKLIKRPPPEIISPQRELVFT
jgi:DNA polymerase I-like protein with 3'-5' exonuclease and polymerase domains